MFRGKFKEIDEEIIHDELYKEITGEMKELANRLDVSLNFNYVTLSWSDSLNRPIVQLWYQKPTWKRGIDDTGYEYAGWSSSDEIGWTGWGVLDSGIFKGELSIVSLPETAKFWEYIIERKLS